MNSHISFLHISTIQLTIAGSKRVKNPSELSYFVYTDTNLWQIPGITVIHDVPGRFMLEVTSASPWLPEAIQWFGDFAFYWSDAGFAGRS